MKDITSKNDERYDFKKRCQTWHQVDLALQKSMPCLALFFDAMSGVKKLTNFIPAIICSTLANEPSIQQFSIIEAYFPYIV